MAAGTGLAVTIDVRPHPDASQWWMAWCERCQDWVRDRSGIAVSSPSRAAVGGMGAEHMRDAHGGA